jgi:hypothetical protein
VDQTWWDSTVAGCSSAWNRPIFNLGNAAVTDSLQRIIMFPSPYVTVDNIEITNISDRDSQYSGENETHVFDFETTTNVTVENCYIHGWQEEFFSIGTGNYVSGTKQITNFVPLSYSPMSPSSNWPSTSSFIDIGDWTNFGIPQAVAPYVSSVSGSNPYTITWTSGSAPTTSCTGCIITLGGDFIRIFAGDETADTNDIAQNNVIDGSDSMAAQLNTYGDCGASEGNNQWCGVAGIAAWRAPYIMRNNVIRYVESAAVGDCQEWSGNLIEYIRLSTNQSTHTNGIECLDTVSGVSLLYNNVERHTNVANASAPGGLESIGLFNQINPPNTSSTTYIFNNVVYDSLQNNWMGFGSGTTGCQSGCGTIVMFSNTSDCGPEWNLSYQCTGPTPCPSFLLACQEFNNYYITTNSTPCGSGAGSNCNTSSGSYTSSNNIVMTPSMATSDGYTTTETYAYSPTSGSSPTVGAGVNLSSTCSAISSAQSAAGTACMSDTAYGATYNVTNHTAVAGARTTNPRPTSGNWDIGAYLFGDAAPDPPQNVVATAH